MESRLAMRREEKLANINCVKCDGFVPLAGFRSARPEMASFRSVHTIYNIVSCAPRLHVICSSASKRIYKAQDALIRSQLHGNPTRATATHFDQLSFRLQLHSGSSQQDNLN